MSPNSDPDLPVPVDEFMESPVHVITRPDHVVAVLVCHEGGRWLPPVLTSLAHSARQPDVVVAIDASSTDSTPRLLGDALAAEVVDLVLEVPAPTTFGASVTAALTAPRAATPADVDPDRSWVWLLHDDCAPVPEALDALLRAAQDSPGVAIVGPKIRGWHDRRLLLEVGATVSRSGGRVTGLEPMEYDQGQHDGIRDVLSVSSAGMLVRRDAFVALGGFDPGLPMFRDDVDLCWRARRAGYGVLVTGDAVVHHRAAASHGRRQLGLKRASASGYSATRMDRAAGLHLLMAHAGRLALPFVVLRLVLGSVLRSLGFLLGKSPQEAADEIAALGDAVSHLRALGRSRARVRAAGDLPGAVPDREVRTLLAPRSAQVRVVVDRAAAILSGTAAPSTGGPGSALDASDPDGGDDWDAAVGPSRLRRAVWRPGTLLLLGLLACTLVSVRALLGAGELMGGALVASPAGAGDLLTAYQSSWHTVGLGSGADAPPWLVLLALPAFLLRGQAPLAVDILMLLAVPMAGVSAYASLRGAVASSWIRAWAAVAYALLPALPVAVGSGRLGTCVAAVLLPPLARSSVRLLGVGRAPSWRRAWGTGLLLATTAAFAPVVWLVAAVVGVVAVVVLPTWHRRLQVIATVLTPVVLLAPWTLRLVHEPGLLLLEPGLTGPVDSRLDGLDLALLHPGGPGSIPIWWTLPLVVAAVLCLLRRGLFRAAIGAWVVALSALAWGMVQVAVRVGPTSGTEGIRPWPGTATLIAGGAMIAVVALAAQGLRRELAHASFSFRQPTALLLAGAAVAAPLAAAVVWTAGVDGPLRRGDPDVVPAFVTVALQSPSHPRALVLQRTGNHVTYELLSTPGPVLGERDVASLPTAQVDRAVGALVAGVGGDEVDVLAQWSVQYVLLQGSARSDQRIGRILDSESGLRRVSGADGDALWQVSGAASRGELVASPVSGAAAVTAATTVPVTLVPTTAVDTPLPAVAGPSTFVLAESAASGWTVRSGGPGGQVLDTVASTVGATGRVQSAVPAGTTQLWAQYEDVGRSRLLWLQAVAVFVVIVLALPGRRRPEPETDEDDVPDASAVVPEPYVPRPPVDSIQASAQTQEAT